MSNVQRSPYTQGSFQGIMEKIQKDKYGAVSILCKEIRRHITGLKAGGLSGSESDFVTTSEVAMAVIEDHVQQLTVLFFPYMQDLAQKEASRHDCNTCSGTCALQHSKQLTDLQVQVQRLKEQVMGPVHVALQVYDTIDHDQLKELYAKMTSLYSMASCLLYEEEECLLPGIAQAQKKIYAKS